MTAKIRAFSEADYEEIGRRHGSPDVAKEAGLALARWERDVSVLKGYGYGAKGLSAFRKLVGDHAAAMASRPEGVAAKTNSVNSRERAVAQGWGFVDKARSILLPLAREDGTIANGLREAIPGDDAQLAAGLGALGKLLAANLNALDPESGAEGLKEQAQGLMNAISGGPGSAEAAKKSTQEDTAAINRLDGRLAVIIGDLNGAGRKAFRNLHDLAKVADYKFHVLKHHGSATLPPPTPAAQAKA
jgi:hypothetical protein